MKSLFELMRSRGQPIEQKPFIDGREVDLYQLYQLVTLSGGSQKVRSTGSCCISAGLIRLYVLQVNNAGTWHLIAKQLGFDVDTSVASTHGDSMSATTRIAGELSRTFLSHLRPYEDVSLILVVTVG